MGGTLVGLDVGFSARRPTSGVGLLTSEALTVGRATSDWADRRRILCGLHDADVSAVDAPLVPDGFSGPRAVEKLLCSGTFQKRCKPGASHVAGTGQMLRTAGAETAQQLAAVTTGRQLLRDFPRVFPDLNIVEAFPNAFLGVCLGDDEYAAVPALRRGKKFDWLYDQWRCRGRFELLAKELGLAETDLGAACNTTSDHEERAALVCLLTAGAVYAGNYVAIGDSEGGYIFLPPWNLLARWARNEIDRQRRMRADMEVWIAGASFSATIELPPIYGDDSWPTTIELASDCGADQNKPLK